MVGRVLTPLTFFQIVSLACLPAIVVALALLYRHQTDNFFLPLWDYVFSIRVAFPPVVLFVAGYVLAFLTGVHLSDVPRVTVGYFRNRYLQSPMAMIAGSAFTTILCLSSVWYVSATPAPKYKELVHTILRGEADDFADAKRTIDAINDLNPDLANRYRLVLETFMERARVNLAAGQPNTTRARLLVRSLSADAGPGWADHPLRRHALAEAYSLLAGAIRQNEPTEGAITVFGDLSSNSLSARSIALYEAVSSSDDSRAVSLMRASALNNLGNAYFYRNEIKDALAAWRAANSEKLGFRNTGTWGNIVAGLVVLGQYDNAIREGEEARNWAEISGKALQETSQFVSIVVNTAFARLARGDLEKAVADFQFANALQEDANTRLNLALSFVLLGSHERAQQVLRSVEAPVTIRTQAAAATSSEHVRCAQLIWFLAEPDAAPSVKAARLNAFRGQVFSAAELSQVTDEQLTLLRGEITDWLPKFPGSCATFSYVELVMQAIRGP